MVAETGELVHLYQPLAVHAALPAGSAASSALPGFGVVERKLPAASASEPLPALNSLVANEIPAGCAIVEKAPTPSAREPER